MTVKTLSHTLHKSTHLTPQTRGLLHPEGGTALCVNPCRFKNNVCRADVEIPGAHAGPGRREWQLFVHRAHHICAATAGHTTSGLMCPSKSSPVPTFTHNCCCCVILLLSYSHVSTSQRNTPPNPNKCRPGFMHHNQPTGHVLIIMIFSDSLE